MIAGLVFGTVVRDAEQRTGASGKTFAIASIRSGSGDDAVFVSVLAFGEQAERLLQLRKGDAVSASGRIELRSWTGRDGAERHGLSIIASEIAAARPRPRQKKSDTEPKPRRRAPYAHHRAPAPAGQR